MCYVCMPPQSPVFFIFDFSNFSISLFINISHKFINFAQY